LTDSFGVQVNYKFGPHGQHMLNVRADTPEELAGTCSLIEQLVTPLIQLGEMFNPVTEPQAIQEIQNQLGGQVIATNAGKVCAHGQMVYKTGIGKNGAPWKAFMCPAPQGAPKCAPEWIKG
jgi:hypothetical protein